MLKNLHPDKSYMIPTPKNKKRSVFTLLFSRFVGGPDGTRTIYLLA